MKVKSLSCRFKPPFTFVHPGTHNQMLLIVHSKPAIHTECDFSYFLEAFSPLHAVGNTPKSVSVSYS